MMNDAVQIIGRILSNPDSCDDGDLVNDLLREFHRGYPVERLRPLMLNENEKIAKVGMWIASELGKKAIPLLRDVTRLLKHPVRYIRYFAIDSVLTCATPESGAAIAEVISMLDDEDSAVRWKVLDFMSRATGEHLHAALTHFSVSQPSSLHVLGLHRLVGAKAGGPNQAISLLKSDTPVLRKYGVVAAARMSQVTREPLTFASSINDEDVSGFAGDRLGRLEGLEDNREFRGHTP